MTESFHAGILRFWELALQLKYLRRQGWIDRRVQHPESDADHSWGVGLLSWLLAADQPHLNRDRVLLLGIVHDLPEAQAGDATPFDSLRADNGRIPMTHLQRMPEWTAEARAAKERREREALERMVTVLPQALAHEVRAAWEEYEAGETAEAQFVQQVDKLETLLQAEAYHAQQPEITIESFRLGSARDVTHPGVRPLLRLLQQSDPTT